MDISFSTILIALCIYVTSGALGALTVALLIMSAVSRMRMENRRLKRVIAAAGLDLDAAGPARPVSEPWKVAAHVAPAAALLLAMVAGAPEAKAQAAVRPAPTKASAEAGGEASSATPRDANAIQYCRNIADAAADARFTRQKEALAGMEKEIEDRIKQLEAKRAEYQEWLDRREEFLKMADANLIAVISQMRPDAAAAQMGVMNEDMAAAVLSKLTPRVASAILNEIDPKRAARLTSTMVGLGRRTQEGRPG